MSRQCCGGQRKKCLELETRASKPTSIPLGHAIAMKHTEAFNWQYLSHKSVAHSVASRYRRIEIFQTSAIALPPVLDISF